MRIVLGLLMAVSLGLYGCGGGGSSSGASNSSGADSDSSTQTPSDGDSEQTPSDGNSEQTPSDENSEQTPSDENSELNGRAVKGVLKNADVVLYEFNGVSKTKIGSTTTNDEGRYSLNFTGYQGGVVIVEVRPNAQTRMICDLDTCESGEDVVLPGSFVLKSVAKSLAKGSTENVLQVSTWTHAAATQVEATGNITGSVDEKSVSHVLQQITALAGANPFVVEPLNATDATELEGASADQAVMAVTSGVLLGSAVQGDEDASSVLGAAVEGLFDESGEISENTVTSLTKAVTAALASEEDSSIAKLVEQLEESQISEVKNHVTTVENDPGEVNQTFTASRDEQIDAAKAFMADMREAVFLNNARQETLKTLNEVMDEVDEALDREILDSEIEALVNAIDDEMDACGEDKLASLKSGDCGGNLVVVSGDSVTFSSTTANQSSLTLSIDSISAVEALSADTTSDEWITVPATLAVDIKDSTGASVASASKLDVSIAIHPSKELTSIEINDTLTVQVGATQEGSGMSMTLAGLDLQAIEVPQWATSRDYDYNENGEVEYFNDARGGMFSLTGLDLEIAVERADGVSAKFGSAPGRSLVEFPVDTDSGLTGMLSDIAINFDPMDSDDEIAKFFDFDNVFDDCSFYEPNDGVFRCWDNSALTLKSPDGEVVDFETVIRQSRGVPDSVAISDVYGFVNSGHGKLEFTPEVDGLAGRFNAKVELSTSTTETMSILLFAESVTGGSGTMSLDISRPGSNLKIDADSEKLVISKGDASMVITDADELANIYFGNTLVGTLDLEESIIKWIAETEGEDPGKIEFESFF